MSMLSILEHLILWGIEMVVGTVIVIIILAAIYLTYSAVSFYRYKRKFLRKIKINEIREYRP